MRNAIQFLLLSFAALAVWVPVALAQTADNTKRVGYVVYGASGPRGHLEQAFLDGMREQGYVEGRNLIIERVYAEGNAEQLRQGVGAFASRKLDAIVTTCSPSTDAAKQVTSTSGTPVIMAVVTDPVGQGLVASLAQPGGNVTGRSSQVEDTLPKMLELFSAVVPKEERIGVLHNTNNPVHPRLWQQLERVGSARNIKLVRIDVARSADFPAAFDTISRERLGALFVLPDDGMTMNARARLLELVKKNRLPTFYGVREFVVDGGLMSYGENYASSYRSAAAHVGKVLAGAKPATLPVEQPTKFEFVINRRAAKELGIAIPLDLLLRADEVIE